MRHQIETIDYQPHWLVNEIIVVDDLSTDSTFMILDNWAQENNKVKLFSNYSRLGSTANFERAISLASSEYIVLCDQDDLWSERKLLEISIEISRSSPVIVVHDASIIDELDNTLVPSYFAVRTAGKGFKGDLLSNLVKNNYLGCCVTFKRSICGVLLPFPRYVCQHDIWIGQVGSLLGRVSYLQSSLVKYRRHASNVSSASGFRPHTFPKILQYRFSYVACAVLAALRIIRDAVYSRQQEF